MYYNIDIERVAYWTWLLAVSRLNEIVAAWLGAALNRVVITSVKT
jgi:hypothetical protein